MGGQEIQKGVFIRNKPTKTDRIWLIKKRTNLYEVLFAFDSSKISFFFPLEPHTKQMPERKIRKSYKTMFDL